MDICICTIFREYRESGEPDTIGPVSCGSALPPILTWSVPCSHLHNIRRLRFPYTIRPNRSILRMRKVSSADCRPRQRCHRGLLQYPRSDAGSVPHLRRLRDRRVRGAMLARVVITSPRRNKPWNVATWHFPIRDGLRQWHTSFPASARKCLSSDGTIREIFNP